MKIGILTSSRADYGIYLPLLDKLKVDLCFNIEIIAFGTHLSRNHGYTVNEIEKHDYLVIHKIASLISNDDEQAIATSYSLTALKFADFWSNYKYDLVLCLGDRFEMNAAVMAGIPFDVKFGHIHGGETTLGAIDNIYRHQITLASQIHFTATEAYNNKVVQLSESNKNIFTVGALSLDNIKEFTPIDRKEFYKKFNIPKKDFGLVTFHPETVNAERNIYYSSEMKKALIEISNTLNLIITMPNADTLGNQYRNKIEELKRMHPERVILIENFGKNNYFSAMHYAKILIGNTSSGILEAASFQKQVINVGDRQKGRARSNNVFDAIFNAEDIIAKTKKVLSLGDFNGENIYYKEGVADNIIKLIKEHEKL